MRNRYDSMQRFSLALRKQAELILADKTVLKRECKNCKYMNIVETEGSFGIPDQHLECRRHAPVVVTEVSSKPADHYGETRNLHTGGSIGNSAIGFKVSSSMKTSFPEVTEEMWCGEFEE